LIAAAGHEIKTVDRIINAAPDLTGPAYEELDGLTRYSFREILLAEQAFDSSLKERRAAEGTRGAAVLAHEIGHALDQINNPASIPEVVAAWQKEAPLIAVYRKTTDINSAKEIDYFTKKWPQGLLETIAELYALRHGQGTASLMNIAAAFPETPAALYKVLDAKGL